ncbi:uncharacterized membrane protein YcaP (DUF421 family) [Bacillus mesophilus]|uniref:DUF421 domain-containing protein n=1 Tax=Bacillus mesophilus TaxID=1808955 RepID=A0A6M0Q9C2_9BACI|nr:DUF421 domain-containing protein [Bacillus mesophilus]MBM7662419.1 uncharacterized membrane protein YcaP (DUF421 family) [Bacillus mesophilus]NEY72954.1 DUF421 domain-containing protein [Bacillus mesophilus]
METLKELAVVLGRILTILPLVLFMTLYMGRRSIGQLPVFDFLAIITLGAVVGADIADPNIEHIHTAFAVIVIAIFQKLIARLKIHNRKIGRKLTLEPVVVIQDGTFIIKNINRIQYSIDNILTMLREKDVFDIQEVHLAIVEGSGNLSVLKKAPHTTVTRKDLQISDPNVSIGYPVIVEGKLYETVLHEFSLNEQWLMKEMKSKGIHRVEDVFFASINREQQLMITEKQQNLSTPQLFH